MRARIALLMAAVVALAACESTKAVDTAPSAPVAVQSTSPAPSPRVVRSALVEDDGDYAVATYKPKKKRIKAAASYDTAAATPDPVYVAEPVAPVSKPDKPAKPSESVKADAAPVTTADAAAPPPAAPTDTTDTTGPAPTDTAPEDSVTPTTDTMPVSDTDSKSMFSDPSALLQAQFGGFPVWVIALVGLVVLAALLIGLGGRKKPEEVI